MPARRGPLNGARVALLEARLSAELSELVRRHGGIPYAVPSVREVPRLEQVPQFLDSLASGRFATVIFLTGAGTALLFDVAERLGQLASVLAALRAATVVCRGPKPIAVLRRHDVPVSVTAAEPYTTVELLDALRAKSGLDLKNGIVALVHYGEPNHTLANALRARDALLEECFLYEWQPPDTIEPINQLIHELITERVDAIVFTSQIQCRYLFQAAADLGKSDDLARALNGHTIVAAIGPVCAGALRTWDVTPDVQPAHPKMGPLIAALADYFDLCKPLTAGEST